MFRKLISNLSFSPALITEVGFYARRLRQEEYTRRLTLVFVALAVVIQSMVVFSPPESANASNEQDLIRGGISGLDDLLARYDHNSDDLKDIYTAAGLTRDELASTQLQAFTPTGDHFVMSRYGHLSAEQGEVSFSYQRSNGGAGIRYMSPMVTDGVRKTTQSVWVGQSATLGWFAIAENSANLITLGVPTSVASNSLATPSGITRSVTLLNVSQGATVATANSFDKLRVTLTATNTTAKDTTFNFSLPLRDALEYASLLDPAGGVFDESTRTLSWPPTTLAANETQTRTFVIQLLSSTPAMPTGESNPQSYDCVITVTFGTSTNTPVLCPPVKVVENTSSQLPVIGTTANVVFAATLTFVVVFFYARTRQMSTELRLIRHNLNTGNI